METPEVASLAALLDELINLLAEHGKTHWANWLTRDLEALRAGDREGVRHFLSAFGGMGSLNDLWLQPRLPMSICTTSGNEHGKLPVV